MSETSLPSSGGAGAKTRCSPQRIAQVVAGFGKLKRKLVAEIGFKGMLKVPDIGNLDNRFSLTLLEKIDIRRRAIKLKDQAFIRLCANDVHHFLDIPYGPNKLFGLEDKSTSEKEEFIRCGIGSISGDVDEKNSLKAAEDILTAAYPTGMSVLQEDQFKVSFVVFCMGNFLVAKYSSNHGLKDYWGSLMNTSEISSYDFCEAVVEEIIEAARHVQKERKLNREIKNVSGCHLFMQAKFLDALNLGILNIADGASPRIEKFTMSALEQMKIYLRLNVKTIKTKEASSSTAQKDDEMNNGKAKVNPESKWKNSAVSSSTFVHNNYTPSSSAAQVRGGYYDAANLSAEKKSRETASICNYVNTIHKPKSTEFLSAYTKGGTERRLNDRQINDLRVHDARMRLLVNKFKGSTLKDMDCSPTVLQTCKEVVNSGVNKFMMPGSSSSPKRCFDNLVYGCEGSNDGFVTPENKIDAQQTSYVSNDRLTAGFERVEIPNKMRKYHCETDPSSSKINEDIFITPPNLKQLSSTSPNESWKSTSLDYFDELMQDAHADEVEVYEHPRNQDFVACPILKIRLSKGRRAKNPWIWAVDTVVVPRTVAETIYDWLGVTENACLNSWWIVHSFPTMKKITGDEFKGVFTKGVNFTEELIDIAIRRFGQTDRDMYGKGRRLRWMHPFETDFGELVLYGDDYLKNKSIEKQLTSKCHEYEIANCRMV